MADTNSQYWRLMDKNYLKMGQRQPRINKPWFMKKGGTPPIVISSDIFLWYPPN